MARSIIHIALLYVYVKYAHVRVGVIYITWITCITWTSIRIDAWINKYIHVK